MDTKKIIGMEKKHVMQTYSRPGFVIDHGKGCYVFDKNGKKYINDFLAPRVFPKEHEKLRELNIAGISDDPQLFLFNSTFANHRHKFIWSGKLMSKVLTSLQFSDVKIRNVGEGVNEDYCIERRKRGIYFGCDWKEDRSGNTVYDPESLVVEAIK